MQVEAMHALDLMMIVSAVLSRRSKGTIVAPVRLNVYGVVQVLVVPIMIQSEPVDVILSVIGVRILFLFLLSNNN